MEVFCRLSVCSYQETQIRHYIRKLNKFSLVVSVAFLRICFAEHTLQFYKELHYFPASQTEIRKLHEWFLLRTSITSKIERNTIRTHLALFVDCFCWKANNILKKLNLRLYTRLFNQLSFTWNSQVNLASFLNLIWQTAAALIWGNTVYVIPLI